MLTPSRYWRVARTLSQLEELPAREFQLPPALTQQTAPPTFGDGVVLADYDGPTQMGLIRYLGIIRHRTPRCVEVEWIPVSLEIWVDTPTGCGNWASKVGFKFADSKVSGYGLHQFFAYAFPDLEPRHDLPNGARPHRRRGSADRRDRFDPVEVIGEPSEAPRGGFVYLLQSAYGFKVGRTRNIPSRMRAFAVKLPFVYTIPLCVWFDDHFQAETAYHRAFSDKRVNGEWFDLQELDIDLVRTRQYPLQTTEL